MDERPEQPPEGKLIADALERSGLSIRKASKRAGISYGRWRQITSGVQNVSPGSYGRVTAPARTLARMAVAVSVTPEQLNNAGRADAAKILIELLRDGMPDEGDVPEIVRRKWGSWAAAPAFIKGIWESDRFPEDFKLQAISYYIATDPANEDPDNGEHRRPA